MVGRSNDEAVRAILLDHQQEAVEYAADLADIVGELPAGADGVELVEEVDAAGAVRGVEDLPELCRRLAHEAGDQRIEADLQEGEAEFARQYRRGHRLARPRRADEQQLAAWRQAVVENPARRRAVPG